MNKPKSPENQALELKKDLNTTNNEDISSKISSTSGDIQSAVNFTVKNSEHTETSTEKLKSYQVLHIEDEDSIRKMMGRCVKTHTLKYSQFTKAEDLIEAIKSADIPTLIISDNNYGGETTGIDLAEATHALRMGKNIPFVLFCSPPKQEEEQKLRELLENQIINVYIQKPTPPQEVIQALKTAIK
ncbi:MAG: response regulator [Candidatus Altimarinota bacterium]